MGPRLARRVDGAIVRRGYREAARVVHARAGNFYFAFLGQPARARHALHAIYAFCREADDVTDDGRSAAAGARALQELRGRIDEVYEGRPKLPRDRALQDAVRAFGIERRDFLSVLSGIERDLTTCRYATFDELYAYCFEVAASVGLLCLPVFGRRDALARRHAVDLGVGMQLTNILRDLAEDGARDRVYVPIADLRRFGVEEEALTGTRRGGGLAAAAPERGRRAGRPGRGAGARGDGALDSLIRFEAERARRFLESGRRLLALLQPADCFCPAVLAAIYGELLDRIERMGAEVLRRRASLPGLRKVWLAARAFPLAR